MIIKTFNIHANKKDNNGFTCLHVAAQHGHLEVLKCLTDQVYYEVSHNGTTPLHLACKSGNLEVVKFLLENFDKC